jgi:uncharacterized membrane protein
MQTNVADGNVCQQAKLMPRDSMTKFNETSRLFKFQAIIMSSNPNPWFEWNICGNVIRFQPKSTLGCLLALLPFCGLFSIVLYLLFHIYFILFKIIGTGLGITPGVEIVIWIAAICCANVNVPLNWIGEWYRQICCGLRSFWRSRGNRHKWHKTSVCINITGGIIPTLLALYQFSRVEANAIFVVLGIVATIGFCSVVIAPGIGILSRQSILTITSLVAALCSIWIAPAPDRVGVAFAGSVLGQLIGADLLHLKDLQLAIGRNLLHLKDLQLLIGGDLLHLKDSQLEKLLTPQINIGGAGMDDGIVRCSFFALIFVEYLPKLVPFLTDGTRLSGFFIPHFNF